MEKTLLLIKPGFLELENEILGRIAAVGGKVAARKQLLMDDALCARHYPTKVEKSFYHEIVEYMTSGDMIAFIIEGDEIIEKVREVAGPLREKVPGTIRGDYAVDIMRNVVHSSDSPENAEAEIKRFF